MRQPLAAWLERQGLGSGRLAVKRIGEGHSNITYLVLHGDERLVLRRPPRPPLPPSAHDVLREARLLKALEGTSARGPKVLAACQDEEVLGVPFYVMAEEHGTVVTDTLPAALDTPDERRRTGEELVDALVEIHAVDWREQGLDWFGKPTGYLERQLRRFGGLWEHNKTRQLPVVQEVGQWLADHLPDSPAATIVHGDFRLGNVMVSDEAPARVVAVFDWELATIGDPLADVGYLSATWAERGEPDDTVFSSLTSVTRAEPFPSRREVVERYDQVSGRPRAGLSWYQALPLWKAAVFMEGNFKRFSRGASDDAFLAMFDEGVPALAETAWQIAQMPAPQT